MRIKQRFIVFILIISGLSGMSLVKGMEYFRIIKKQYVVQGQLILHPKFKDNEKQQSMDILNYNENYNLLFYSNDFLSRVMNELKEVKTEDISIFKRNMKFLYSSKGQIMTVEVLADDRKSGVELAEVTLNLFIEQSNAKFTYAEVSKLGQPIVIRTIQYNFTLLFSVFSILFFLVYILIYLMLLQGKSSSNSSNSRMSRRNRL